MYQLGAPMSLRLSKQRCVLRAHAQISVGLWHQLLGRGCRVVVVVGAPAATPASWMLRHHQASFSVALATQRATLTMIRCCSQQSPKSHRHCQILKVVHFGIHPHGVTTSLVLSGMFLALGVRAKAFAAIPAGGPGDGTRVAVDAAIGLVRQARI